MDNSIRISSDRSVIVIFEQDEVLRLTPTGFQQTEIISCSVFEAKGMSIIGFGESLRASEDEPNDSLGSKVALERAMASAFPYDREARRIVFATFFAALAETPEVAQIEEVPQVSLPIMTRKQELELQLEAVKAWMTGRGHQTDKGWTDCSFCAAEQEVKDLTEAIQKAA